MSKVLFVLCMFLCLNSVGQLRVGVGGSIGLPQGDFGDAVNGGFGVYLEPKLSKGNIEVAINAGLNYLIRDFDRPDTKSSTITNTTIVGYYFLPAASRIKPYLGFGLGPYYHKKASVKTKSTEFGFMPKAGINRGVFDLGLSYKYPFTIYQIVPIYLSFKAVM